MIDNSSIVREHQPEVLPAPEPFSCTIALPNGLSIPFLALHDVQSPPPPPPHDASCTFHFDPHLPSNCKFCQGVDDCLGCGMDSASPPVAPSPSQSSVPEVGCSTFAMTEPSPSFSPVSLPSPPPRASRTRAKRKTPRKNGVVPDHMTSVFRTRTHKQRSSSSRARGQTIDPLSSASALRSSPSHQTSRSSRRDPRCCCSLPPDVDWVRHWRLSCGDNPDRRHPCPNGCGLEFTRKDNAKRHVKEGQCSLMGDSEGTLGRPSDASSFSSGSTVSPSLDFFF